MADRDLFDARLAEAVRALADRAQTHVDADEVADRTIRDGGWSRVPGWLRTPEPARVPVYVVVLGLLLLALLAWSIGAGTRDQRLPAPLMQVSTTPSPAPTPDRLRPARASGQGSGIVRSSGEASVADGARRVTGIHVEIDDSTSDPRVSGQGTLLLDAEITSGDEGSAIGRYALANSEGAWEGPCSGVIWGTFTGADAQFDVAPGALDCWLVGSGEYAGLTYYRHSLNTGGADVLTGLILSLEAPAPPSAAAAAPTLPSTPGPQATSSPADGSTGTDDSPAPISGVAQADPCCPIRFIATTSDERVSGDVVFDHHADVAGDGDFMGAWEYGDMNLTNFDGSWDGWCAGAGWMVTTTDAVVSCWLVGSGDYGGLTYYQHLTVVDSAIEISGIILPLPVPVP